MLVQPAPAAVEAGRFTWFPAADKDDEGEEEDEKDNAGDEWVVSTATGALFGLKEGTAFAERGFANPPAAVIAVFEDSISSIRAGRLLLLFRLRLFEAFFFGMRCEKLDWAKEVAVDKGL